LSCARILAGENLPLAPKKRMCIAIALLLHGIGEEGKKVRGAWTNQGAAGVSVGEHAGLGLWRL
jgi:hypothetical protein